MRAWAGVCVATLALAWTLQVGRSLRGLSATRSDPGSRTARALKELERLTAEHVALTRRLSQQGRVSASAVERAQAEPDADGGATPGPVDGAFLDRLAQIEERVTTVEEGLRLECRLLLWDGGGRLRDQEFTAYVLRGICLDPSQHPEVRARALFHLSHLNARESHMADLRATWRELAFEVTSEMAEWNVVSAAEGLVKDESVFSALERFARSSRFEVSRKTALNALSRTRGYGERIDRIFDDSRNDPSEEVRLKAEELIRRGDNWEERR